MIKRPLCIIAVLYLLIQSVNLGFREENLPKPSSTFEELEKQKEIILQGTVRRWENRSEYRLLYLKDNSILQTNQKIHYTSDILVYLKTNQKEIPKIGNKIQVTGELFLFETAKNPGNFDSQKYYRVQGIGAGFFGKTYSIINTKEHVIQEKMLCFREAGNTIFVRHLGESHGGIMSAILLGIKGEMDSQIKTLYQKSGIAHILSISGLHMSFLGLGFYQILRKVGVPFWIAGCISILFLSGYLWMIGGGVAASRAFFMFLIRVGADLCGRPYDMGTSLAIAAVLVIVQQPYYLMDASFLLSFGAIIGILVVTPFLLRIFFGETKPSLKIYRELCSSLGVTVMLLPILLYYYYEFPPYSVFLNLLLIPFTSLQLSAGVVGLLLCIFSDKLGGLVLQICKWILILYEMGCRISMKLPKSRIVCGRPQMWWIVFYYSLLLLFGIYITYRQHQENCSMLRIRGIMIGALFLLFQTVGIHRAGLLQVTMVDVGQGDSIFLRSPKGRTYLIDGGSSDVENVAAYRLIPYLESQGVMQLDYVFVSHGDADHINGIQEILETTEYGIGIQNLVLPPVFVQDEALKTLAKQAKQCGVRVVTMEKGKQVGDGSMKFTCLGPSNEYRGNMGNSASMILSMESRNISFLFTGDVEGTGEEELTSVLKNFSKEANEECYQILKVAHHGSKNSTTDTFLEQLKAKIAWISAGEENQYGHPHEETIQRLQGNGYRIYNTQKDGAITLLEKNGKATIETFCKNE
ncbi:MAG: DNA internalization-related competence protein ComEC/Rec2 [Candidatus Ruminococcus intestinipullorum]|nr:DNA internalization-related competence protein ComEC/Rec2 [Candidatus Ruminococcus intestinipullorum]